MGAWDGGAVGGAACASASETVASDIVSAVGTARLSAAIRADNAKAARVASRVNANVFCTANAPGRGRGFFFVHREES